MKREEEIRKSAFEYIKSDAVKAGDEYTSFGDFINGARWADEHPHWISVEDELPPKNEAYLAFWQHLGVTRYRFVKSGAKVSRTFSEHITHWMPLPQAPTEEIRGNQGETSPNEEGGEER